MTRRTWRRPLLLSFKSNQLSSSFRIPPRTVFVPSLLSSSQVCFAIWRSDNASMASRLSALGNNLRQRLLSSSRKTPNNPYSTLPLGTPVEEETLPYFKSEHYYPVKIGDVYEDRYQVAGKIGYGAYSTSWLCQDLRYHWSPWRVWKSDSLGKRKNCLSSLWGQCLNGCQRNVRQQGSYSRIRGCSSV